MPRRPPGMHPFAQSGRGGPGSQAVRRLTPTTIFAYQRKITGVPLQPGQAQTVLAGQSFAGSITRGNASSTLTLGNTNGGTLTWTASPAAGQKVLLGLWANNAETLTAPVDNGLTPTTFVLDKSVTTGSHTFYIYRGDTITLPPAGSYAVTVSGSGGAEILGQGFAYAGVKSGAPSSSNTGTGTSSSVNTGTATPALAGALFFAGFANESGANPETITLTAATFTSRYVQPNGAAFTVGAIADSIASGGPSATAATWTLGDAPAWAAAIVTYDAAPVGGPAAGQVTLGPVGVGSVWYPAQVTISTTSGVNDTSTFNLYLGPAGVPITLVGTLFPGGAGTIALAIPPMSPGQYLIGVWSGGHAGDLASMNVIGSMDAVTVA